MPQVFNPHELLKIAVQIEKNGVQYYSNAKKIAKNDKVKETFEKLAQEEKNHVADFTKIQEAMKEEDFEIPEEFTSEEVTQYLHVLADGQIFPFSSARAEILKEIETEKQAIMHAISFEKDSIIFFQEIFDLLPPDTKNRDAVAELIRQEKIHVAKLFNLLKEISQ